MKALVTGARGFLGSALCALLCDAGVEVHATARVVVDKDAEGFFWHQLDVREQGAVHRLVEQVSPDWVFHLAADTRRARDAALLPELFATNVEGTRSLLRACEALPLKAFISVGSFEEYGDHVSPFREDMLPRPVSPYGMSKTAASLLTAYYGRTRFPAAVLRFPIIYGPGQPVDSFLGGACAAIRSGAAFPMSPGEQTRDFVYVADAAKALLMAAQKSVECRGEILNACSGVALTLRVAVATIAEVAGKTNTAVYGALPYRPHEQMSYVGDRERIQTRVGWKPTTSFADGIRATLS